MVFYSVRYYVIQNVHCEDNTWSKVQDTENYASLSLKNKPLARIINSVTYLQFQFHTPSNQWNTSYENFILGYC